MIAVKGPTMAEVAGHIGPLIGPKTVVLPAMNGVPWWFCEGMQGVLGDSRLQSIDPDGSIIAAIPLRHVIGCVVHASARIIEPGLAEHHNGQGLMIGECDGRDTARVRNLAGLLTHAGFDVTVSSHIRRDLWYKLWGNLTINPISALTGATTDRILDDPLLRTFCSAAMGEVAAVGEHIGCGVEQSAEERHGVTRKLGAFKSSMLQDVESGKPLELDMIVGAVREIGQRVGVPTPNIDILYGLTRLFARARGLYPP